MPLVVTKHNDYKYCVQILTIQGVFKENNGPFSAKESNEKPSPSSAISTQSYALEVRLILGKLKVIKKCLAQCRAFYFVHRISSESVS